MRTSCTIPMPLIHKRPIFSRSWSETRVLVCVASSRIRMIGLYVVRKSFVRRPGKSLEQLPRLWNTLRTKPRRFGPIRSDLQVEGQSNHRVFLERAMGIEPTSEAWEASILPLYDARSASNLPDYTRLRGADNTGPFWSIFQNQVKCPFLGRDIYSSSLGQFRNPPSPIT